MEDGGGFYGRVNGRRRHGAGTANNSPVKNDWGKRESGQKKSSPGF